MVEQVKSFDNLNQKVIDDFKNLLSEQSRVAIAASCFSIYAFDALKSELEHIKDLRFIFTSPTFSESLKKKEQREFFIPKLNRERSLYGTNFEIRLRNQLFQHAIAKECAQWVKRKARFKSNISDGVINGTLLLENPESKYVYLPFNDFTTTGLGCDRGNNLSPSMVRMASPMSDQFLNTFNELWSDQIKLKDVTDIVVDNINQIYKENSPDFIYFFTLYNIFREFLEDLSEDVLPNEATGFQQSVIWKKLFNFQKDAALAIINKLEKYNGCILADSVGLGKTFTALAVIKYYENRNKSVLVLCPKKLQNNWNTYRSNYVNNPLVKDRLRYDVLFHTDLSRERGQSNGMDLSYLNWGNYDLIVIDESHNFRNGGKITPTEESEEDRKENRYLKLMNKAIKSGVKTKVLMLSATPVNNSFSDLKNQLQLAYEGDSTNINGLLNIKGSIEEVFRQAQHAFTGWTKLQPEERTTERLLERLSYDFFQVLDAVTIARSRKHVSRYYDTTSIGSFPSRLAPISRRPAISAEADKATYQQIARQLNSLNLALYTPSNYILPSRLESYQKDDLSKNLSMAGREKGIRKLMAINLLKRLESSVNSFRLTLSRIEASLEEMLEKIASYEQTRLITDDYVEEIGPEGLSETEDELAESFINGKKLKIRLSDLDYLSWRYDLEKDLTQIRQLLDGLKSITPEKDNKLETLKADIRSKLEKPINDGNNKVLIFTAFSDTAEYLYKELSKPLLTLGLNVGLVTGSAESRSTVKGIKADFNTILTLFSPLSKDKEQVLPNVQATIDVLIATDCISEGQNLQDCDYVVNYDIHWNPVRLIQRFGRIDRIGSKNKFIQMVNYWPDMQLDEYMNLKGRVESRMKATVLTSTGDDNLLSNEEKVDLDYRKEQLRRLQNEIVDLEDMDTGINIMDLGLNEFRMDLLAYLKKHPDIEHAPFGIFAMTCQSDVAAPGVIFILKNKNNEVNINKENRLHPFYMVYISHEGEVICDHLSPKQLLDTMRAVCKGKSEPINELCQAFDEETNGGIDMQHYSTLLQKVVESIIEVNEESDIASLFSVGETSALLADISGMDDFELICFLVIK